MILYSACGGYIGKGLALVWRANNLSESFKRATSDSEGMINVIAYLLSLIIILIMKLHVPLRLLSGR